MYDMPFIFFFFQAEDGIRDLTVTGVQTCALPILLTFFARPRAPLTILTLLFETLNFFARIRINSSLAAPSTGRAATLTRSESRSEERRVGKECRCWGVPYCDKKKYDTITISSLNVRYAIYFFFFSSRRRHTRFDCDWSSDVCSSDLTHLLRPPASAIDNSDAALRNLELLCQNQNQLFISRALNRSRRHSYSERIEIGRASCRERV